MNKPVAILVALFMVMVAVFMGTMAYLLSVDDNSEYGPFEEINYDAGGGIMSVFTTRDDIISFLEDTHMEGWGSYRQGLLAEWGTAPAQLDDGSGDSSGEYSETNVQVEGIDEEDIVKTDGKYIYSVSDNEITIIEAYPPENMKVIVSMTADEIIDIDFNYSYARIVGIFIDSGKLVAISNIWVSTGSYYYWIQDAFTMISVISLEDVNNPSLENCIGISGYFAASRLMEDCLYVVANYDLFRFATEETDFNLPELCTAENRDELEPQRIIYDPEADDSSRFVDILALNLNSGKINYLSVIAGYTSVVYMSHNSLYLTNEKWIYDDGPVEPILIFESENRAFTKIFKLDIDMLNMKFVAEGEVRGHLLNQFSLDEYQSYLRVATTNSWNELENNIFVLDEELELVGALEGLAPDERIYSARFMGETLYLVTFRQIDPFFVIDLSNPTNPKVLGELEIPGFSSYLHPVDDSHVLGIGMEDGRVKISLFNVSDPMHPVETGKYVIGTSYSWSEATWNHKAVLFDEDRGVLSIPISTYGYWLEPDNISMDRISGACVLKISIDDGIVLMGFVSNDGEIADRSIVIDGILYTVSSTMIKANDIGNLTEINSVRYYPEGFKSQIILY